MKDLHEEHHYSCFLGLSKTVEVPGKTNDFSALTVQRKPALSGILGNQWHSSLIKYIQDKLRLYTSL